MRPPIKRTAARRWTGRGRAAVAAVVVPSAWDEGGRIASRPRRPRDDAGISTTRVPIARRPGPSRLRPPLSASVNLSSSHRLRRRRRRTASPTGGPASRAPPGTTARGPGLGGRADARASGPGVPGLKDAHPTPGGRLDLGEIGMSLSLRAVQSAESQTSEGTACSRSRKSQGQHSAMCRFHRGAQSNGHLAGNRLGPVAASRLPWQSMILVSVQVPYHLLTANPARAWGWRDEVPGVGATLRATVLSRKVCPETDGSTRPPPRTVLGLDEWSQTKPRFA